jgi:hypothetical protein
MFSRTNTKTALGVILALASLLLCMQISASEDVVHIVKGVVKSVDKDSKTMVVKTADGTEHTVKWTDKTTMEGGKDVGEGIAEGTKVSVKYTEKGGEKTAVAVKTAGKATGKAME